METISNDQIRLNQETTWKAAAVGWRKRDEILRKGAAPVTVRMLALAQIKAGSSLLDIASGTGEPAISAAKVVGNEGYVVGSDLVDEMLNIAREKAQKENLSNIEFHRTDGETLDITKKIATKSFDAVTIRWGLMFMPEPEKCLNNAYHVLKNEGRIVVACWANPERNPFINLLLETLGRYTTLPTMPENSPGVFSFSNPARLRGVMTSAGFKNIEIEEVAFDVMEVEDGKAYWEVISDLATPVIRLVNQLDAEIRERFVLDVTERANELMQGDRLKMKGVTWLASANR